MTKEMQEEHNTEPNHFDKLPDETITDHIKKLLVVNQSQDGQTEAEIIEAEKNGSSFVHTCYRFYRLSQNERLMAKFRECIVAGNKDQAKKLLTIRPDFDLVSKRGIITDWSDRTFFHCSAFEYSFWTLNIMDMCQTILDCLPKNEHGIATRLKLLKQAKSMQANGLSYELNGVQHQEKLFSLDPLKQAHQDYIKEFNDVDHDDTDDEGNVIIPQQREFWCTQVGGAQGLLPANIRQRLYCTPGESLDSIGQKIPHPLRLIDSLDRWYPNQDYYERVWGKNPEHPCRPSFDKSKNKIWDKSLKGLGSNFAILKTATGGKIQAGPAFEKVIKNLATITKLQQILEADIPLFMQQLEESINDLEETGIFKVTKK